MAGIDPAIQDDIQSSFPVASSLFGVTSDD